VRSEGKSGYHSSEGNIKYDCVLVCRKRLWAHIPHVDQWQGAILSDAVYWTKRTLESDMPVNAVDVFAIVMGQSLKHYTQECSNGLPREQLPLLPDLLGEMARQVSGVGGASDKSEQVTQPNAGQVQQLALFIMESRAKYGSQT
jgi:hypothetical protein